MQSISFTTRMMRAVIAGKKTQTRRVVKPQPPFASVLHNHYGEHEDPTLAHSLGWFVEGNGDLWPCNREDRIRCPYGRPGDYLWLKETYALVNGAPVYAADHGSQDAGKRALGIDKWQPSRFMPRKLSRHQVQLLDVGVGRPSEMTQDDIRAEGIGGTIDHGPTLYRMWTELWEEINSKRGFGIAVNPLVWKLTFKLVP